jgi:hypothetical protein
MKTIFILLFSSLYSYNLKCFAEKHSIKNTCLDINIRYNTLKNKDSFENEIAYAKAFPNNFSSFIKIFGYSGRSNHIQNGCFYKNSLAYIEKFFDIKKNFPIHIYLKILSISKNSYWQSDGMTIFQYRCIELISNDKAFLEFLNTRSESDIKTFNRFILLNNIGNKEIKNRIKVSYSKFPKLHRNL